MGIFLLMIFFFFCFVQDLENYITELIPTLPQLEGLEKSFHSFYVCTAVRKFLFFLDPLKLGKVRIQDILASGFLDELLEVKMIGFFVILCYS
jgi:serine/threonine-protein phosphatase 2A regulatory subunit B''/actin-binding protein anillin